jgi:hypothetical protein
MFVREEHDRFHMDGARGAMLQTSQNPSWQWLRIMRLLGTVEQADQLRKRNQHGNKVSSDSLSSLKAQSAIKKATKQQIYKV